MGYWHVLAAYTVGLYILLPFAESARQTRMRIKPVIGIPLVIFVLVTNAALVLSAVAALFGDSLGRGLLRLTLAFLPPLVAFPLLRPLRALGRWMGDTALNAQSRGGRLLRALMEPMDVSPTPQVQ